MFVELDRKRVGGGGGKVGGGGEGGREGGNKEGKFEVEGSNVKVVESQPALTASGSMGEERRKVSRNPLAALKSLTVKVAGAGLGRLIGGMYRQLDSAGFSSGEEFRVAIEEGVRGGANIVLGDRDVDVTLNRLAQAVGKVRKRSTGDLHYGIGNDEGRHLTQSTIPPTPPPPLPD